MKLAETVTFGGSGMDRFAQLRGDTPALNDMIRSDAARIIVLWRGKPLIQQSPDGVAALAWVGHGHPVLEKCKNAALFLGRDQGGAWFAQDISGWDPQLDDVNALDSFLDRSVQHHPELPQNQSFTELRAVMAQLSPRDAELAATARALYAWHQSHAFCAKCGAPSDMSMAGWQRDCPSCKAPHFPRTDPVVIMLITQGNNVLLGRSPGWPDGMYSLLAGFVEPGETMEAAVRREVFEESGIQVGEVCYLASQPWPFPASLMLGCAGTALNSEINIDPTEIEDAQWFSREDLLLSFAGKHPLLKPARKGAIAHFLLQNWLADRLD